jgi:hypothetical protein
MSRDLIDLCYEYLSESTDSPSIFNLSACYWLASTLLGRYARLVTAYATKGIAPNLWVMLIGPSRISRKTTVTRLVRDIVEELEPELLTAESFTPEALYELFSNLQDGASIAWIRDEFNMFFIMLKKKYMYGVREILNLLYMGLSERRKLRDKEFRIPRLYVTILGNLPSPPHIYITDIDFYSGFMNRFLLVYAKEREKRYPLVHISETAKRLRDELLEGYSQAVKVYDGLGVVPVSPTTEAMKLLDEYDYHVEQELIAIERENPTTLWKLYLAETPQFLLKMSILRRVTRPPYPTAILTVEREDVERAKEDLEKFLEVAKLVVEDVETGATPAPVVTQEKAIARVYYLIQSRKHQGISKSELLQKTLINARELNEILITLAEQEKIVAVRKETKMRGRPGLWFWAAEYKNYAEMEGEVLSVDTLRALLRS